MVKKKFKQNSIIKKNIIKIIFSILIAFLITLISEKLQKKEYTEVKLDFIVDRDVRMELSLLPTSIYRTDLEEILLSDSLKLQDFISDNLKINQKCSFVEINNDLFISVKMQPNEVKINFVATEDFEIKKCVNEINSLLNSMVSFYLKNKIRHKKKSIEVMELMQKEFDLSGSLVDAIIDLETLKNLESRKNQFFVNNYKTEDKSPINVYLTFISLFITILFLLNLSFVIKLLNIKKNS